MRALSAEAGRVGTYSGLPRRLGGLARGALASASGGGGGECGGPGRGRSVRTRLSRGNYNPAAAPAYRAASDPSKRVAWEFGRRQRLAGEAFGAAATASAAPLPQGRSGDGWGGGRGWRARRVGLVLHPLGPVTTPPQTTPRSRPNLGHELRRCTALWKQ